MKLITRYVFNQLIGFFLAVAVSLSLAVWLAQSLRFIDLIVNDGVPASNFFYFVILLMPYFLVIVLPLATFCTVLFIYNKLNNDQELIVLRASGFSQFQLAKPGLVIALTATTMVYALNLYFLPVSYREFRELKAHFAQNLTPFLLKEGQFNTISDTYTIYFKDKSQTGQMENIIVHDGSDPDQEVTFLASSGALLKEGDDMRVVLWDANRQSVDRESGRLSIAYSDQYVLEFGSIGKNEYNRRQKPRELFVTQLLNPDSSITSPEQIREMRANAHYRLGSPLFTFAMAMVAMATMLSGEFSRRGNTKRLLTGIGFMAFVMFSQFILKDWTENLSDLIPLIYIWPLVVIAVSVFLMKSRNRPVKSTPGEALAKGTAS
ncbi:LptF/LptG family permease [Kiloniella sp. b19]|uniref:LptF/LptG family permease n=1 Tax=Kiloniella sp. GXU_MW_B19 TaxID=3141326 RepID=UPI0031D9C1B4